MIYYMGKHKIKKTKSKYKKNKKTGEIYKEFGPGLRYLIYDGNKHVFKFIKDNKKKKE